MAERTDGRQTQTEDASEPPAVIYGNALEGKVRSTYRAYLDHMSKCQDCPQSAFHCAAAAALWRTYREARR